MYRLIDLKINRKVLPLFNFLKNNPTRTIGKDNHVIMTYFEPPNHAFFPFSYKGITVSIQECDSLDNYLIDGWQIVRDYKIASVKDKLLNVLSELELEYLNQARMGSTLTINGIVYNWIAYGLSNTDDVISFVKVFYLNGYSYEQIIQLYTNLTKSTKLNVIFLNTLNNFFKEEMNERIYGTA